MQLRELELTKDLKSNSHLDDIFAKYGWTFLGHGADATVAEHPNKNYVLKVFNSHSGYKLFTEFVHRNQNNPHLPKLSSKTKKIPGVERYSYIRMEKLTPLSNGVGMKDTYYKEYLWLYIELRHAVIYDVEGMADFRIFRKAIADLGITAPFEELDQSIIDKLFKKSGLPDTAWQDMARNFANFTDAHHGDVRLDLHRGNFMLRGQTLVMIDPYL